MTETKSKRRGLGIKGALIIIALSGLITVLLLFRGSLLKWPWQNGASGNGHLTLPAASSGVDLTPDPVMGWNAIDFQEAILGETREVSEYVVLEQDVKVDTTITTALANIDIFRKTKVIHSFGTGVYAVNLGAVTEDSITVDTNSKTVAVAVPHAALKYLQYDVTKTTFEETQNALFAFGNIKLDQEQQQLLDEAIDASMRARLSSPEMLAAADDAAVAALAELFSRLVSGVSDEFTVAVDMK